MYDVSENKTQIDSISLNMRFRNADVYCKTYTSADGASHHFPVLFKLRMKLPKLKQPEAAPNWH